MFKHDLENIAHAFISSRIDYCNVLLTGLPKKTLKPLQMVQNSAASILTKIKRKLWNQLPENAPIITIFKNRLKTKIYFFRCFFYCMLFYFNILYVILYMFI